MHAKNTSQPRVTSRNKAPYPHMNSYTGIHKGIKNHPNTDEGGAVPPRRRPLAARATRRPDASDGVNAREVAVATRAEASVSDATDARARAGRGEVRTDDIPLDGATRARSWRTRGVESSARRSKGHRVGRLRGDDGERRARGGDGAFGERRRSRDSARRRELAAPRWTVSRPNRWCRCAR